MKFDKYVAAGNDFIIINGIDYEDINYNKLAIKICNRHFGIGADGLMVLKNSLVADGKMLYYNSNGSQGEMCGNGIRSFSKYLYDYNIINRREMGIETLAGVQKIKIDVDKYNKAESIHVDMQKPIFNGIDIPVNINKDKILNEKIIIEGKKYIYSAIRVGVPHVVIFLKEKINDIDINRIGELIENHINFPEKTNVNFVQVIDSNNINIYTWERGAGRTLGCGTGSCASVVVGNLLSKLGNNVYVRTEGGDLKVKIDEEYNITMSGGALHIGSGKFNYNIRDIE